MRRNDTLRVAITGGIGSGKSFVCKALAFRGIEVYDCDAAAKRLMRHSQDIRQRLIALIGPKAYDGEALNKAAVARFMMEAPQHTQQVNDIVHPAVAEDFLQSGLTWIESAILFDCGFDRYVDKVVCVTAPLETRIQRVMERDAITRDKVLEWMGKQWPQELVRSRSDFEIVNDGQDIGPQVDRILQQLYEG